MKKELEKKIIFAFLSGKYKMLTAKTVSRSADIPLNIVHNYLDNSSWVSRAKKRTRRGEILYYLTPEAKSIFKIEERDFSVLVAPVKQLLSNGQLHKAIQQFFTLLKDNTYKLPQTLVDLFKEQLTDLSKQFYQIEDDRKSGRIDSAQRFAAFDKLVYSVFESTIEFELLCKELEQYRFSEDGMTIKLDRDFDSFTTADSEEVLAQMANMLQIPTEELKLTNIQSGSVILTLEMDDATQAEKLFLLIRLGKLRDQGIVDARLKELNPSSFNHENGNLPTLKAEVKSALKKGDTRLALRMLDDKMDIIPANFHNEIISLCGQHANLSKEISMGIHDPGQATISRNRISFSVLDLLGRMH